MHLPRRAHATYRSHAEPVPHSLAHIVPSPYAGWRGVCLVRRCHLLEAVNRCAHGRCSGRGELPTAPSDGFIARLRRALPNTSVSPLHVVLAAKRAVELLSLKNFVPLDKLSQGRAIASAVLTRDADLLRVLGHGVELVVNGANGEAGSPLDWAKLA